MRYISAWIGLIASWFLCSGVGQVAGVEICSNLEPTIQLPLFTESKLNVEPGGFLVIPTVVNFTSAEGNNTKIVDGIFWEIELTRQLFVPVNSTLSIPTKFFPSSRWIEDPPNRPVLSIPSEAITDGSYRFRLTATIGSCVSPGKTLTASSQISFTVNDRPHEGITTVSPLLGVAFSTPFTLSTTGWIDADLPLQFAFEFLHAADGQVDAGDRDQAIPLSEFRASASLADVVLSSIQRRHNYVIAIARDALGGIGISNQSQEIVLFPLYEPGTTVASQLPLSTAIQKETAVTTMRNYRALIVSALQTKTLQSALIPTEDVILLQQWQEDITRDTVSVVAGFISLLVGSGVAPDVITTTMMVQTLESALTLQPNIGRGLLETSITSLDSLVALTINGVNALKNSFGASGITTYVHPSTTRSFLNVMSQLAKGIDKNNPDPFPTSSPTISRVVGVGPAGGRRRLQQQVPNPTFSPVTSIPTQSPSNKPTINFEFNLRRSLQVILFVAGQGLFPGTPLRRFVSSDIDVTMIRESRGLVGTKSLFGLTSSSPSSSSVSFPQGLEILSDSNLRPPRILINIETKGPSFTPDVLATLIETVDVVLVDLKVNLREMVETSNDPPGYNRSSGEIPDEPKGIKVDGFDVKQMTSLIFASSAFPFLLLDPFNLSERINVTLPLPPGYQLPDPRDNMTLACGAWDETFEGWSSEGCEVVEVTSSSIVCSCNHASDFAAWTAFLKNVGGGDVGVLVTISVVVVGVLFPGLLMMYTGLMLWARLRDQRDAHGIHIGALLLLTKNTIRLKQMQRRFFKHLRNYRKGGKGKQETMTAEELLRKQEEESNRAFFDRLRKQKSCYSRLVPSLIRTWIHALLYEHTVFGVYFRFDPYYPRTQRATVITAIVCGNLFVCALFFDLKTAQEISTSFTIAVVLIASVIVAIPVKFMIRFLFRETRAKSGSLMDRVSHIYRISQLNYDVVPGVVTSSTAEKADLEMLLAFRKYYVAKTQLKQAELLLEEAKDGVNTSSSGRSCCGCLRFLRRRRPSSLQRKSLAGRVGLLSDSDSIYEFSELQKIVLQGRLNVKNAKQALRETCENATLEWSKIPRIPTLRSETLRKQRSSLMRIAALLFDEEDVRPKPRRKICKHGFIYAAWFLVFVYLGACLAFSARWLLAYTSLKPDSSLASTSEDADTVIVTWLIAASLGCVIGLFVSEPVLQFFRFSLIPICLRRCGRGIATKEEIYQRHRTLFLERQNAETRLDGALAFSSSSTSVGFNTSNLVASTKADKKHKSMEPEEAARTIRGNTTDQYVQSKAWFHDLFWRRQRQKKKGETHVETMSAGFFDFASEVVDAIA